MSVYKGKMVKTGNSISFYFFISVLILGSLSCTNQVSSFDYISKFYSIQLSDSVPFIRSFTVDALGKSNTGKNTIQWKKSSDRGDYQLQIVSVSEAKIYKKGGGSIPIWDFKFEQNKFTITSNFMKNSTDKGIEFRFDKNKNNTTLLGVMVGEKKTRLPAVLHLPDMGSFQLVSDKPGSIIGYDASRIEGEKYISVVLPEATISQPVVTYAFTATSVYPRFAGVEQEKFNGLRRNYINLYQVNPRLGVLANNSCSDPCAFTLFLSSMLALNTPPSRRFIICP